MSFVVQDLSRIQLFEGLPADMIATVAGQCRWDGFHVGDQIFDKDSDTLDVYFVQRGGVRILNTGPDGREVALADIPAGQYFGELAAIDGLRRSARAVATSESMIAALSGPAFLALMRQYPDLALRVLERLTRIIRSLDHRVTELSTETEAQRIYRQILRLARPDSRNPQSWIIDDLPNHKEIAAWTGTSREAVAQAIGELARDGIVRRRGMGLVVSDWPRLSLLTNPAAETIAGLAVPRADSQAQL